MHLPVHVPNQLREYLRALRKQRGLTQAQLGQLLGLGQARIAEIERNPGVVSVEQLLRLLSALNASLLIQDDDTAQATARPVPTRQELPPPPSPQVPQVMENTPGTRAQPAPRNIVIPAKKGSW